MSISVGTPIAPGAVVLAIDDRPVIAFIAAAPLWRDIAAGTSGEDVSRASRFLKSAGVYRGPLTSTAGARFVASVRELEERAGLHPDGILRRSDVVWLGPGVATLRDLSIDVGSSVRSGEAIGRVRAANQGVAFEPAESLDTAPDQLTVGSTTVALTDGETAAKRVTEPDSVAALQAELAANPSAAAFVTSSQGAPVGVVPATAVVTDLSGSMCVFPDASGTSIKVVVATGTLTAANVDPALVGRRVLLNPRETRVDLSCD